MARHLIVTADDMGYNVERNRGIIDCFENGGITNSSLMVNGIACEDAAKLALKHGLPTGLHFNITEGVPVRTDSKYSTLTEEHGHFLGPNDLRDAAGEGKIDVKEVKEELAIQIARYKELMGSTPVYVDGHQHVHVFPGLAETFAETLSEHGIQATRLPYELNVESTTWAGPPWGKFLIMVSSNAEQAKTVIKANNIWTSDAYYGLMTMGRDMTAQRLQTGIMEAFDTLAKSADSDQPITCELMTHPGYMCKGPGGCGDGPDDFSQSSDREYEKSIIESEEMKNFYKANNITLLPYHKCVSQA